MNCQNCGHPLQSDTCEYCGTWYPDFPGKKQFSNRRSVDPYSCEKCGTKFIWKADYDLLENQCKIDIGCSRCNDYKRYYINREDFGNPDFSLPERFEYFINQQIMTPNELRSFLGI